MIANGFGRLGQEPFVVEPVPAAPIAAVTAIDDDPADSDNGFFGQALVELITGPLDPIIEAVTGAVEAGQVAVEEVIAQEKRRVFVRRALPIALLVGGAFYFLR